MSKDSKIKIKTDNSELEILPEITEEPLPEETVTKSEEPKMDIQAFCMSHVGPEKASYVEAAMRAYLKDDSLKTVSEFEKIYNKLFNGV